MNPVLSVHLHSYDYVFLGYGEKGSLLLAHYKTLFSEDLVNTNFIIACLSHKKLKLSMFFPTKTEHKPNFIRQFTAACWHFSVTAAHPWVTTRGTFVSLGCAGGSGEEPRQLAGVTSRGDDPFVRGAGSLGVELLEGAISGADCPTTLSRTQPEYGDSTTGDMQPSKRSWGENAL